MTMVEVNSESSSSLRFEVLFVFLAYIVLQCCFHIARKIIYKWLERKKNKVTHSKKRNFVTLSSGLKSRAYQQRLQTIAEDEKENKDFDFRDIPKDGAGDVPLLISGDKCYCKVSKFGKNEKQSNLKSNGKNIRNIKRGDERSDSGSSGNSNFDGPSALVQED